MSAVPHCKIIAHSDSPHLSQVYTGFRLLQQAGALKLHYELGDCQLRGKALRQHAPPLGGLYVQLNDGHVVYYDVRDGADFDAEALDVADFYFKRSYSRADTPAQYSNKVMPLGLNYEIYPDKPSVADIRKWMSQPRLSKYFLRSAAQIATQLTGYPFLFVPTLSRVQAMPDVSSEPRILFMMHAWDPDEIADLPEATRADRRHVNAMRAECVSVLRQAFGERFYGGFAHSEYALKHYPDALLPDNQLAGKAKYLELLKNHAICIATTGLHGSIGWKFAEYVAFSRAIVSEQLAFEVPHGFQQGSHYLAFSTAQECAEVVARLMQDTALRTQLMQNNHAYYQHYLKPDQLVAHTLAVVSGSAHVS